MDEPNSETAAELAAVSIAVGAIGLAVAFIAAVALAFTTFGWIGVPLPFVVTAVLLFITAVIVEYSAQS